MIDIQEAQWYVIHTYSGYEDRVKGKLEQRINSMNARDKIFQVVIPTEVDIVVKEGHRQKVPLKIFPGYILVQMKMHEESWNVVRNTPGVTGFVGVLDEKERLIPVPLGEEEVQAILHRMEEKVPRVKVEFHKGQGVRITSGPFADFLGVVDEINTGRGKVKVLVSFFGRETPIELDLLQVERS